VRISVGTIACRAGEKNAANTPASAKGAANAKSPSFSPTSSGSVHGSVPMITARTRSAAIIVHFRLKRSAHQPATGPHTTKGRKKKNVISAWTRVMSSRWAMPPDSCSNAISLRWSPNALTP